MIPLSGTRHGNAVLKLYPSTVKGKRYTVYVPQSAKPSGADPLKGGIPKGNKQVKVDFGSSEHDNYTIHKDIERKRLYQIRHKNDHINDPYSAGFWSWWVLWNKPSLSDSFKEAVSFAKTQIR